MPSEPNGSKAHGHTSSSGSKDNDSLAQSRRQLAFILDIDGCLSREGIPIPGSVSALQKLRANNIPFVFCTNGGGQLESTRALKLSQTFGIEVSPEQIILSHTPLRTEVVPRYKNHRVLIVGENCGDVARAYGLTKAEDISEYGKRYPSLFPRRSGSHQTLADDADDPVRAVLFFEDPEDLGEALQLVLDVLLTNGNPSGRRELVENDSAQQEVEIWFTNPDLVYSGLAIHPRLTQGSYRMCLETLFHCATSSSSSSYVAKNSCRNKTGRPLLASTVGKPTSITGKTALAKILAQCPPRTTENDLELWTVGDNPYSDVALAHTMGWKSALVRTGIWKGEPLEIDSTPTRIADSFGILLEALLSE